MQRNAGTLEVLKEVCEGRVAVAVAAEYLGLSSRHVRRLVHVLRMGGEVHLEHGLTRRPSNRRLPDDVRNMLLQRACSVEGAEQLRRIMEVEEGVVVSSRTVRRMLQPYRGSPHATGNVDSDV